MEEPPPQSYHNWLIWMWTYKRRTVEEHLTEVDWFLLERAMRGRDQGSVRRTDFALVLSCIFSGSYNGGVQTPLHEKFKKLFTPNK